MKFWTTSPKASSQRSKSDGRHKRPSATVGQFWVSLCADKIPGQGEDAPPIIRLYEDERQAALLGVFDGLGGAGGRIYESVAGERHSGAYYAARIARSVCLTYFRQQAVALFDETFDAETFVINLRTELTSSLQRHLELLRGDVSRLRSSLLSRLPTTTALAFLETDSATSMLASLVIWSGDSRVFVLSPIEGLVQISVDDLRTDNDAFDNLTRDAIMSNYASADRSFHLNYSFFSLPLPAIVLAATDGCYQYLPTPMHWEHLLLETMSQAAGMAEWSARLTDALSQVAGDDVSLALVATGWWSFAAMQQEFAERLTHLQETYIDPLIQIRQNGTRAEYHQASRQLWQTYRLLYEWTPEQDNT